MTLRQFNLLYLFTALVELLSQRSDDTHTYTHTLTWDRSFSGLGGNEVLGLYRSPYCFCHTVDYSIMW